MNIPAHLKYTSSHEWVELKADGTARIGITDYAQAQMGDIVFINLPAEGDTMEKGGALTDIESVKAVEDIISPVSGTVISANALLEDHPESINADPYGAWICEMEDILGADDLLDADGYRALIESAGE